MQHRIVYNKKISSIHLNPSAYFFMFLHSFFTISRSNRFRIRFILHNHLVFRCIYLLFRTENGLLWKMLGRLSAFPRNLISRRLNEGESWALPFFEYARIPVGNDVKNAYATMMSADICSLTIWDCLVAPRRISHIPLRFSFPN